MIFFSTATGRKRISGAYLVRRSPPAAAAGTHSGEYDMTVRHVGRGDEMGAVARAIEQFRESGLRRLALEKEQENARLEARKEDERQRARVGLTDAFAQRVQVIIKNTADAAGSMFLSAENMGEAIANTSHRVSSIANASSGATANVQSVAAAAEQMSATVREIAQQIARSTTNIHRTVQEVGRADGYGQPVG